MGTQPSSWFHYRSMADGCTSQRLDTHTHTHTHRLTRTPTDWIKDGCKAATKSPLAPWGSQSFSAFRSGEQVQTSMRCMDGPGISAARAVRAVDGIREAPTGIFPSPTRFVIGRTQCRAAANYTAIQTKHLSIANSKRKEKTKRITGARIWRHPVPHKRKDQSTWHWETWTESTNKGREGGRTDGRTDDLASSRFECEHCITMNRASSAR
ncbi:hypothetical protein LX36DRAFT_206941 [Colletotrichum falcatum]|nr:hypothetical protein LX36DRAFT_206941 [Colletotrichum falcatum]